MVKLFPIIPEAFSYLLPEAPNYDEYENWVSEPTFDEGGLLHSYDDMPVFANRNVWVDKSRKLVGEFMSIIKFRKFCWYSHGEVSREAGKPPIVLISSRSYSTSNEVKQSQSYGGMPSLITIYSDKEWFSLAWHENGRLHRGQGLPALVVYNWAGNLKSETFYDNGLQHRGNSLPSEISTNSKSWRVQGVLHNTSGYASELIHSSGYMSEYLWSLYGVEISETTFHAINTLAANTGIPLYAAFLIKMRLTSLEHLDVFRNDTGAWKTEVPVTWVLRALNVTPEIFAEKIKEAQSGQDGFIGSWLTEYIENQFNDFLRVIAFEASSSDVSVAAVVSATPVKASL